MVTIGRSSGVGGVWRSVPPFPNKILYFHRVFGNLQSIVRTKTMKSLKVRPPLFQKPGSVIVVTAACEVTIYSCVGCRGRKCVEFSWNKPQRSEYHGEFLKIINGTHGNHCLSTQQSDATTYWCFQDRERIKIGGFSLKTSLCT